MSDYFERIEDQLVARVQARGPRSRRRQLPMLPSLSGRLVPALAVAVVIVVVALVVAVGGHRRQLSAGGFAATPAAMRAATIIRERLSTAGVHGVHVTAAGGRVTLTGVTSVERARVTDLTAPGRLAFYDWEGDALLPSGQTVASRLRAQDPAAMTISQGRSEGPGGAGAGGRPLSAINAQMRRLRSRRGKLVVLQASGAASQYFLLKDRVALSGRDIVSPRVSTDSTGSPDVSFGFTAAGARRFTAVTRAIAHRGAVDSPHGESLFQHFAVAVDGRLLTVPYINFRVDPDGINGGGGADITGGFTRASARDLAAVLRYGPLPPVLVVAG